MNDLQDRLDHLREMHGVVGATLAVLHDGEVHCAASGLLNSSTGVEATTDSVFQIGSITKVWTATVLMQLVDEGTLDLDVPVRAYLPALQLADENTAARLTTRHLLNHTSGIDGDHFLDTGRGDDALERYVASLKDLADIHPIGATFSYCNAGFSLAGRIIEVLTGQLWDSAMRERLYEPLGLEHTMTLPEDVLRFRAALGHVEPPGAHAPTPAPTAMLQRSAGPAGLISSTAADVVTFARLHLDGGRARGTQVLSADSVRSMQMPLVPVPGGGGASVGDHWGLGWSLFGLEGGRVIGHDGGTIGQSAFLRIVPEAGVAVVLLTNGGGDVMRLFTDLVRKLLRELAAVSLPDAVAPQTLPPLVEGVERFVGRYERIGSSLDITAADSGLRGLMSVSGPAAAVWGASIDVKVAAQDPQHERFLFQIPQAGWSEAAFSTLPDGRRCLHLGGRAYVKAA